MNIFLYTWMYESWIEDLTEQSKFAKNQAILTGSFSNMELAQKMVNKQPTFSSSDEDFEKTAQLIEEDIKNKSTSGRRKRRGVIDG